MEIDVIGWRDRLRLRFEQERETQNGFEMREASKGKEGPVHSRFTMEH